MHTPCTAAHFPPKRKIRYLSSSRTHVLRLTPAPRSLLALKQLPFPCSLTHITITNIPLPRETSSSSSSKNYTPQRHSDQSREKTRSGIRTGTLETQISFQTKFCIGQFSATFSILTFPVRLERTWVPCFNTHVENHSWAILNHKVLNLSAFFVVLQD